MADKFTPGSAATNLSKFATDGGGSNQPSSLSRAPNTFGKTGGGILDDFVEGGVGFVGAFLQSAGKAAVNRLSGDSGRLSASQNREIEPGISAAEQRAQAQLFGVNLMDQNTQIALALGAVGLFLLLRK